MLIFAGEQILPVTLFFQRFQFQRAAKKKNVECCSVSDFGILWFFCLAF